MEQRDDRAYNYSQQGYNYNNNYAQPQQHNTLPSNFPQSSNFAFPRPALTWDSAASQFNLSYPPPQASSSQLPSLPSSVASPDQPDAPAPKKRGRKPMPGAAERRKEQNRQAQKTFREKREAYLRDLEGTAASATENYKHIFSLMHKLAEDNNNLRAGLGQPAKPLEEILKTTPLQKLWEMFHTSAETSQSDGEPPTKAPRTKYDSIRSSLSGSASDNPKAATSLSETSVASTTQVKPVQAHNYQVAEIPPDVTLVSGNLPFDNPYADRQIGHSYHKQ